MASDDADSFKELDV